MAIDTTSPRSRRALLGAGLGALAASAASALGGSAIADATSPPVLLGSINDAATSTIVRDNAADSAAVAFVGRVTHATGSAASAGIKGQDDGTNGTGVAGIAINGPTARGVYGQSTAGRGVEGASATGPGVYGHSASGRGVQGNSTSGTGVLGSSTNGTGVQGVSTTGSGVVGRSTGVYGYGVTGVSTDSGCGVYGTATGTDGAGVFGYQDAGATYAGYFAGNVFTTGTHNAPISRMVVDHPDAPADRYYQQALVGSFEQVSIISGNAVTGTDGRVTVKVPLLFARYHTDVRYVLTPLGAAVVPYIVQELDAHGRFIIASDKPGLRVSWQLTGLRCDPSALKQPLRVDAAKPARYRGRYVQPALYGQPQSRSQVAPRLAPSHPQAPPRPR